MAIPTYETISGNARFSDTVAANSIAIIRPPNTASIFDGYFDSFVSVDNDPNLGDYTIQTTSVMPNVPVMILAFPFNVASWIGIWSAETPINLGDIVFSNGATDSDSLVLESQTDEKVTGATEPVWSTSINGTTNDVGSSGTIVWKTLGTIKNLMPMINYYVPPLV